MYLISRPYAIFLIEKYTTDWAQRNLHKPYCSDWIITKNGNQALIYPPLGVEEGGVNTDNQGQIDFHKSCKEYLFNENNYL